MSQSSQSADIKEDPASTCVSSEPVSSQTPSARKGTVTSLASKSEEPDVEKADKSTLAATGSRDGSNDAMYCSLGVLTMAGTVVGVYAATH
jgi:hypothetical protein